MLSLAADHTDFSYDIASDAAGCPARVAIFGADAPMRAQMADDLGGAGFRSIDGGPVGALLEGPIALLGDVVVVDCPVAGSTLSCWQGWLGWICGWRVQAQS